MRGRPFPRRCLAIAALAARFFVLASATLATRLGAPALASLAARLFVLAITTLLRQPLLACLQLFIGLTPETSVTLGLGLARSALDGRRLRESRCGPCDQHEHTA